MMEAFELDIPVLQALLPPSPLTLEIGVGSGILSSYASIVIRNLHPITFQDEKKEIKDIEKFKVTSIGVDINPDAVRIANLTFENNNVSGRVYESDLTNAVQNIVKGKTDVLIFNPPYVPSEQEELLHGDMFSKSYAGGDRGREVLDRFIPTIPTILSKNGIFYVVVLHPQNEIDELSSRMKEIGMIGHVVVARKEGIEMLAIVRYATTSALETLKSNVTPDVYKHATRMDATSSILAALRRGEKL